MSDLPTYVFGHKRYPVRIEDLPPGSASEDEIIAVAALAADAGVDGMSEGIPRQRCVILLARIADGRSWSSALASAGLSWGQLGVMGRADPEGFGALLKAAELAKDAIFRRRGRDALVARATDGWDEPVFGGIGEGRSGQVGSKRRYSDKLLEFGLARMDPATFGDPRSPASVQIGQQIVYNVTGLQIGDTSPTPKPAKPGKQLPQDAEIADDPGDNPAKIDLGSLER